MMTDSSILEDVKKAYELEDPEIRAVTIRGFIPPLVRGGHISDGAQAYAQALAACNAVPDPWNRCAVQRDLGVVVFEVAWKKRANQAFRAAIKSARAIKADPSRAGALGEIALCLAGLELNDLATELFREAFRIARSIPNEWNRNPALEQLEFCRQQSKLTISV